MSTATEIRPRTRVSKADVREMFEAGAESRDIAAAFGVSERTVQRWTASWGFRQAPDRRPTAERVSAGQVAMLEEGMPATWAAEGGDVTYGVLSDFAVDIPGHDHAVAEWLRTWPSIYHNEELLKLHYQFAPNLPKGQEL